MRHSSGKFKGLLICGISTTLFLYSCVNNKKNNSVTTSETKTTTTSASTPTGKIAYINLDTLEARYEYFRTKKADFEKKTAAMEAEVEKLAQGLQSEYNAFQKKAQAGTLSQAEGEAGQKKLGQMQQNIESRRQALGSQLMKEQEAFNKELQKRLDDYLVKYNVDKGYDFIMSYVKGGSILYANKSFDITDDVIKFMNQEEAGQPATGTQTGK